MKKMLMGIDMDLPDAPTVAQTIELVRPGVHSTCHGGRTARNERSGCDRSIHLKSIIIPTVLMVQPKQIHLQIS